MIRIINSKTLGYRFKQQIELVWKSNKTKQYESTKQLKKFFSEYLKAGDYNVVAVDWSKLSSWDNYPQAANNAVIVGEHVGKMLSDLIRKTGLNPKNIHIVGHSLGSHVSAHIGREIQKLGLGKIGRITALDPAKPWFDGSNRPQRISKSDAEFVDVIHTNSGSIIEVTILNLFFCCNLFFVILKLNFWT